MEPVRIDLGSFFSVGKKLILYINPMKACIRTAIIILLLPAVGFSQIPKGTNTIKVNGVTFRQVVNNLLDSGFLIDRIDSNFQTVETRPVSRMEFDKKYVLGMVSITMKFFIRVKDSSVIIKGGYNNNLGEAPDKYRAKRSQEDFDFMVKNMNRFALSFNKPVEYLIE